MIDSYTLYIVGKGEIKNLSCQRATELRKFFRSLGEDAHIRKETNL